MKQGPKIIYLRQKVIAAVGCVAAALLMICWVQTRLMVLATAVPRTVISETWERSCSGLSVPK